MRCALLTTTALLIGTWPATVVAAAPTPTTTPKSTPTTTPKSTPPAEATPHLRLSPRKQLPWIERWAPELNSTEVTVYGGMLVTSPRVELFEASFSRPDQGYQPFARVAPAFGMRASVLPLRWGGAEIEAGAMPTRTAAAHQSALLYTARGALVGQLPLWSVTPFVLVGGGVVGVASDRTVVGNDIDVAMYAGGGVKVHLARFIHVRLDVRNVVTARRGYQAGVSNNPEILLGVGMTMGRRRDMVPVERRSSHR